jgi:hypothetical protein
MATSMPGQTYPSTDDLYELAPIREPTPEEVRQWRAEFEAAARRPLKTRFKYAFIHTYKPILDDAPFRAFETTAEYRAWCEANLPSWLGYGRAV